MNSIYNNINLETVNKSKKRSRIKKYKYNEEKLRRILELFLQKEKEQSKCVFPQ